MKRNAILRGIVCAAIGLLGAPCLAQSSGMVGPELRQWIEDPEQGLAALREGRIADLPKPPGAEAKAAPAAPAPVPSDKAVEITFVDPGMEAAVRDALNRPTGPTYDVSLNSLSRLEAAGYGIQTVADLQYMPNLAVLYLSNNQISTLADFPPMPALSVLALDVNQLSSFAGMPSMPYLRCLTASNNRIDTLAGMPQLPMLYLLYLSNNQITSLAGMPELPMLQYLRLAQNRMTGLADLTGAPHIYMLDVSHNALQSLADMPLFREIYSLNIAYNQLATAAGLYAETPVRELLADHNQLSSLGVIGRLDRLETLSVGSNQLTSLDGTGFSLDLYNLDVSRNRLASLAGVENYPNLNRLNAAGNCIKSTAALAGLDNLNWLSLAGNGLNSLADFPAMPELESLDLSCNQLTALAGMGDTPKLQNLEARFNQLQFLDPGFRGALGYLGVSSNGLTSLATLNGATTPSVYMIDASFNNLASLQGVGNLQQLTSIAARGNRLASLADLGQNPRLNWLDVSSNQLASFDDLPSNPPLTWLNASRNQITSLSGLAAAANLYLSRLDVSRNLLTSVAEIAAAANLYRLDMSDNQVSDIVPLQGRQWQELGIANNPTGDAQSVLYAGGTEPTPEIVSVGPGQLPSLAAFAADPGHYQVINATGPEYGDLGLLPAIWAKQLRVTDAAVSNLAAWSKSMKLYGGQVNQLALADDGLSDIAPLSQTRIFWLDVSGNTIADLAPVTSGYRASDFYFAEMPMGIQRLDVSANPVASLAPALGRDLYHEYFPPIGALIFNEYDLEQFGLTPEQAHNCLTFDPVVDVTGTPVSAAPEVAQLRAEGVRVRTDGTCSYCEGACVPPLPVTVPDVAGMTQEAASAALEAAGLAAGTVARQCSETVPAGLVISQDPAAGVTVDAGSDVALLVSLGSCTVPVTVPNVVGQTPSEAVAVVQAAGLLVGSLTQEYSGAVPAGLVLSQNPAACASVPAGTAVALVISLGPNPAEGEPQPPLGAMAQALLDGFDAADSDGNGRLSLAEAQAAQPGLTGEDFAALDRNGDGALSRHELEAYLDDSCGGGCRGCHGGHADWGGRLGGLCMMFLGLMGLGLLGNCARP